MGVEGAMVKMISHGFISGALFSVGVLYERVHSRQIGLRWGKPCPQAAFMMLFAMANAGLLALPVSLANFWL